MYQKPPPTDGERTNVGRRRLLGWIGGISVAGFVGATLVPLADLSRTAPTPATAAEGLAGQRLVYAHVEPAEHAVGGHEHSDDVYVRAADFERRGALDASVAYPEQVGGEGPYAVMLHGLDADLLESPTDLALTDDGFVAYGAGCTHCGTLLRWVEGGGPSGQGVDECPLHGCQFDPSRGGEVVAGPATEALPQVGVAVAGDGVFALTSGFGRPSDGE